MRKEEKELNEAIREMVNWWTSETKEFRYLVVDLLSGLPGSEKIAEFFMVQESKHNCGWKEIDLVAKLFSAINTKDDVEKASEAILEEHLKYQKDLD
jgi:3-methyladenine DNA glycosylase AlkD